MLGPIENAQKWKWAAFGKHPAAGDYFRLGEKSPFFSGLFHWMETGYQQLVSEKGGKPDFCSWRFWAREAGKDSLVCGVIRVSSDSFGRPFPLAVTGAGPLKNWQKNRHLLPFACEKTWCQIEYLAAHLFPDLQKMEEQMHNIKPPDGDWAALAAQCRALNEIGSPLDPFASFPDLRELRKTAQASTDRGEILVALDRGPCNDKIVRVGLWHWLFKEASSQVPNAMFMGGTLDKAYLALFNRPLKPADFSILWSIPASGTRYPVIGTEFSMDISELAKQPINAEKPAGSDIRYDPDFDALQTEIDKLASPALAGSINWEKIGRLAADILMHKSKDLLVASYLAVSLLHTRRNDGFAVGLKLYLDLCEQFWEGLFPARERMRGRVRAVEWWLEKTEAALQQVGDLSFPSQQIALIKDNLSRMEIFLAEHLELAPGLGALKEYFCNPSLVATAGQASTALRPATPENRTPETVPTPTAQPAPPAQRTVPEESPPASVQDAAEVLQEGLRKISESAYLLFQKDPAAALPYRLARQAHWHAVETLPPANNGRTRIPAPAAQEKNLLFDLRNNSEAEALLKAAEARLGLYIFWLDLNRLAAEALSRLGSRFEEAHQTVCQETAFLLQRLPGLENLTFADGTPFATPETRQWLAGLTFRQAQALGPATQIEGETTSDMAAESAAIHQLMQQNKLVEAMEALQQKLRNCTSQREKLLWRLTLSEMMVNVGKPKLALPHLDQVLRDLDRFKLEEYDPGLAMKSLKLTWFVFDSQPEVRFKDLATDVLHRIGRLDMPEMVRLANG